MYSRNRHGSYHYTWTPRVDPNTTRQQEIRGAFATAAALWPFEPKTRRDAWETYALNVLKLTRAANPRRLSAFHYYMGVATMRGVVGQFPPYVAPTNFTVARLSPPAHVPFLGTFVTVNFDPNDPWLYQTGGAVWLYQSRPQPATVNHWTGPFTRFGFTVGSPSSPPLSLFLRLAFPPFGTTRRIFIRTRVIEADNRFSPDNVQAIDF